MIIYVIIILISVLSITCYGKSKEWEIERYLKLILSILVSLGAGIIGSIFTIQGLQPWYSGLEKPWFAPPGQIISVIWVILYILMGISLFIVLNKGINEKKTKLAMGIFAIQLTINAFWSYLFFGLESLILGLFGIIALWITVSFTIYLFNKISKTSSYLLIPYIIWLTIALLVNISLYILN